MNKGERALVVMAAISIVCIGVGAAVYLINDPHMSIDDYKIQNYFGDLVFVLLTSVGVMGLMLVMLDRFFWVLGLVGNWVNRGK